MKTSIILVIAVLLPAIFSEAKPSEKIVNGSPVPPGKYPFMVSVQEFYNIVGWHHWCGATILNENWVMTVASGRFNAERPDLYKIRAGSVNEGSGGVFHEVIEVIKHEDYIFNDTINDIALLKVDPPFDFTDPDVIGPVTLPEIGHEVLDGEDAVIMGWGSTTYEGNNEEVLLETNVKTISDASCANTLPTNPELFVCAADPEFLTGLCERDHGGPLLVNNVQVGITQTFRTCSPWATDKVEIFTEVSAHLEWINSKIN